MKGLSDGFQEKGFLPAGTLIHEGLIPSSLKAWVSTPKN